MMKTKLFLSAASLLVSLGASSGAIGGALAAPVADPVVADPVVYREASASSTPDKFVPYGDDFYSSKVNHYVIDEANAIGNFTYTLSSDGTYYTITGWSAGNLKTDTTLNRDLFVFPSKHSNGTTVLPVKAVNLPATSSSGTSLSSSMSVKVVFGSGIETISMGYVPYYFGDSAKVNGYSFYLSLPDTLTSISDGYSYNLNNFYSSSTPTYFFNSYNTSLPFRSVLRGSFELPDKLVSIGAGTFHGLNSITSISIPSSVTTIEGEAFCNMKSLTSITVPKTVTSVGKWAFRGDPALTSAIFFGNGSSVPEGTFYDCASLSSVVLSKTLITISKDSFNGCKSLSSIDIPDTVNAIGEFAFYGCSISYLELPDGLLSVMTSAFCSNSALTTVLIPSLFSYTAFVDVPFLQDVYYYGTDVKEAISYFGTMSSFKYARNWYAYSLVDNADGAHWHYVDGKPVVWSDTAANNSSSSQPATSQSTDDAASEKSVLIKSAIIAGISLVGIIALFVVIKLLKLLFKGF